MLMGLLEGGQHFIDDSLNQMYVENLMARQVSHNYIGNGRRGCDFFQLYQTLMTDMLC